MNLLDIYKLLENENLNMVTIDAEPVDSIEDSEDDVNSLLIINRIESDPEIIKALRTVQTPTAKYKLILQFAEVLGISQEEFHNTIANLQIYSKQNEV